jgi:hypothetical protein
VVRWQIQRIGQFNIANLYTREIHHDVFIEFRGVIKIKERTASDVVIVSIVIIFTGNTRTLMIKSQLVTATDLWYLLHKNYLKE